jgi:hypothetical protein
VRNANAYIVHGNTLTMECFGGYAIRGSAFGASMKPLSGEEALRLLTATRRALDNDQQAEASAHFPQLGRPKPTPSPGSASTQAKPAEPTATRPPIIVNTKGQFEFGF